MPLSGNTAYILVQCDEVRVAPLRKALIFTQEKFGKEPGGHVVISNKYLSRYFPLVDDTYHSIKIEVMERAQGLKDGKFVTGAFCRRCNHEAATPIRKAGAIARLLQSRGWKIWVLGHSAFLVCEKCATEADRPFSIFSPYYAMVDNKPLRIRIPS